MSDHHLSPAAAHHHPSATVLSPQFQEQLTKTATSHPHSSPSTTTDYRLYGFTKLPLPHSFPAASLPPLRRTISEPIYSPDTINSPAPLPEFTISPVLNQPRQMQFPTNALQRTISDPYPVAAAAAGTGTPPRPPGGRKASRSPSCGNSPSTKRLKRMRARLKEMSQWWNEVVSEGDDEDDNEPENDCNHNIPKEISENCEEIPSQEDVWIETKGECLVLNFKCPCSKGYEVLLSGNNCYYKLTGF